MEFSSCDASDVLELYVCCYESLTCLDRAFDVEVQDVPDMLQKFHNCIYILVRLVQEETDPFYLTSIMQIKNELEWLLTVLSSVEQPGNVCFRPHEEMMPVTSEAQLLSVDEADFPKKVRPSEAENSKLKILVEPKSSGLSEIAGMDEIKELLRDAIEMPIKFPQIFNGNRRAWNRVLIFGPPGTGKTKLVHSLAAEFGFAMYCITSADLLSSYVGETEKTIQSLFSQCFESKHQCIVFIDEVDCIFRKRNSKEDEYSRRIKTELLTQLNTLEASITRVFFICATNCPWDLDTAFLRRFQRKIYVPLPDKFNRLKILQLLIKDTAQSLSDNDWYFILEHTEGFSGSDLSNLINCALYEPIKDLKKAASWNQINGKFIPSENDKGDVICLLNDLPPTKIEPRGVQLKDFQVSLKLIKKTVPKTEDLKCQAFLEDTIV